MELIDIYDKNDVRTGLIRDKNAPRTEEEYRRICELWVVNQKGEYLIQKRSDNKKMFGGMWYCTAAGGCIEGEESIDTCLREAQEELGLTLNPARGQIAKHITESNVHFHIWCFFQEVKLSELVLEPFEVSDVRWATADEIRSMIRDEEFIDLSYYEEFFRWVEAQSTSVE